MAIKRDCRLLPAACVGYNAGRHYIQGVPMLVPIPRNTSSRFLNSPDEFFNCIPTDFKAESTLLTLITSPSSVLTKSEVAFFHFCKTTDNCFKSGTQVFRRLSGSFYHFASKTEVVSKLIPQSER